MSKPTKAEATAPERETPVEKTRVTFARDVVDCATNPPTLRAKGSEHSIPISEATRYARQGLIETKGVSIPPDATVASTPARTA